MNERIRLNEIARRFRTAMLISRDTSGTLHARPMEIAELTEHGDVYFSTSASSPKIAEMEADTEVLVTLQNEDEFVTLSGTARVLRDLAQVDRLWSDDWRVWFPKGRRDPSLCLIHMSAHRGEYWDRSGAEGMAFEIESAKAVAEGRTPKVDRSQNAKVDL